MEATEKSDSATSMRSPQDLRATKENKLNKSYLSYFKFASTAVNVVHKCSHL